MVIIVYYICSLFCVGRYAYTESNNCQKSTLSITNTVNIEYSLPREKSEADPLYFVLTVIQNYCLDKFSSRKSRPLSLSQALFLNSSCILGMDYLK